MIRFASIACTALLALSCTKSLNNQICKDIEFAKYHLCIEEGKSGFLLCPDENVPEAIHLETGKGAD